MVKASSSYMCSLNLNSKLTKSHLPRYVFNFTQFTPQMAPWVPSGMILTVAKSS